MEIAQLLEIYRVMWTARCVDRVEQELATRGQAFFQVSGAGHESAAVLGWHLCPEDYLCCHYRDKGLLLARGLTPRNLLDNLLANAASGSAGRQMCAHVSDRRLNVVTSSGPVGNAALHAVGLAMSIKGHRARPIVVCSLGDGTTQEGEFLEACAEAVRSHLPVLFLIQDNQWAISTRTVGQTFFSLPSGPAHEFLGRPIERLNGRDACEVLSRFEAIVTRMRSDRGPEFVVLEVDRLTNHTHADDQSQYRTADEIREACDSGDPLPILEARLLAAGVARQELERLTAEIDATVRQAAQDAGQVDDPPVALIAKRPLPVELMHPSTEKRGTEDAPRLTMREALREVLRHRLTTDPRVTLYGEDIEDPKGDVFGVTKGLSTAFPERVRNSPLAEATIVGASIGRAMAGERPVAFIQFADFLHVAFNQIASDLSTIFWRSVGQWSAPVIVMVPCGAYRPGLGPFHGQSVESLVAHLPGIDVFLPSTACDAAGLLNAAFQSARPTLLFYPKALLNDPETTTSNDVHRQFVPIGTARKVRVGRDLTLVAWGNTVRICERAATELERVGLEAEILDLRCLSPWDERAVLASAEKTANLIVVHEENLSGGFGAEILATVSEKARVPVAMRRVARPDTHLPFNYANALEVLPSLRKVLDAAAELVDLDITWLPPKREESGLVSIDAIGSGPADETVIVADLLVQVGEQIVKGQPVATLEATKSVFELSSSTSGEVVEVVARPGDTVTVGSALLRLRSSENQVERKRLVGDNSGAPVILRKPESGRLKIARPAAEPRQFSVGISAVTAVEGSREINNDQLLRLRTRPEVQPMTAEDVVRRTGIERRCWIGAGQNAADMAVQACWQLLDQEGLIPDDLNLVICSTTSPTIVTPSMACQVLHGLTKGKTEAMLQAYDINAACSGYLYALQAGFDFLQSMPHGRVLVVTTEVLSPLLDPNDFDTSILFGDAASATILYGEEHLSRARGRLRRPELSAKGDDTGSLRVPLAHDGFIQMKGRKVFTEAVRAMVSSLNRVCHNHGLHVDDLTLVVPHQANQRILDAIQSRIGAQVYSNIREHGNTSSTSIPLCLHDLLPRLDRGNRLGLCAFGGGFTFGAGLLEMN